MGFLDWLGVTAEGLPLNIGDSAPDAITRDEQGNKIRLIELYGDGYTLVYFYPKANTPGCTKQACSLRDGFASLQKHGIRVIGVSSDEPRAQLHFKEKYRLPFVLLADYERGVAKAFGVSLLLGMTHRQSFLIKGGAIVWRDLHASTRAQADDILKAVARLGG